MQMLRRKLFVGFGTAVLTLTCLSFASGKSHQSSDRAKDVTFGATSKFQNGATLPAGTYKMEVPDNSQTPNVTFSQNGKPMATVQAKVVTEEKKNSETEVDAVAQGSEQAVTAIRPAGWNEELTFGPAGQ
jgi:tetraacyldisaccharide-1-P 4'-kinase